MYKFIYNVTCSMPQVGANTDFIVAYNKSAHQNKDFNACLLSFILNSRVIFDCIFFGFTYGRKDYVKPEKPKTTENSLEKFFS